MVRFRWGCPPLWLSSIQMKDHMVTIIVQPGAVCIAGLQITALLHLIFPTVVWKWVIPEGESSDPTEELTSLGQTAG